MRRVNFGFRRHVLVGILGLGLGLSSESLWANPAGGQLPDLIDALRPSVVPVGTYAETDSPRFGFRGSGFVVGAGQYVVSNAHVLPAPGSDELDTKRLAIMLPTERGRYEQRWASVEAMDRAHDLVLLKMDGAPGRPLRLAPDRQARDGQDIVLLGFPLGGALGFSLVTHHGIVSAISAITMQAPSASSLSGQAVRRLREGSFDVLQLDATAYPGNSGGPVCDRATGEVLGVLNMVLVKRDKESAISVPTGISYAIPVEQVRALLRQAGVPER